MTLHPNSLRKTWNQPGVLRSTSSVLTSVHFTSYLTQKGKEIFSKGWCTCWVVVLLLTSLFVCLFSTFPLPVVTVFRWVPVITNWGHGGGKLFKCGDYSIVFHQRTMIISGTRFNQHYSKKTCYFETPQCALLGAIKFVNHFVSTIKPYWKKKMFYILFYDDLTKLQNSHI